MDIFDFINSKDIAYYLSEINYRFSALEASWVVYQSKYKSISEKTEAWLWIINNMPDAEVPERINCSYKSSLRQSLMEYIQLIKRYMMLFSSHESNSVYRFSIHFYELEDKVTNELLFYDLDSCIKSAKCRAEDFLPDKPECIEITKQYVGKNTSSISQYYDHDMNIIYVKSDEIYDEDWDFFEGMYFKFPTPFVKGDILTMVGIHPYRNWDYRIGAFVLEDGIFMPNMPEKLPPNGDSTDMTAWGYFVNDKGVIYNDVIWNYMDLEYVDEELKLNERILFSVSKFLKGDIDIGHLLNAQRSLIGDEISLKCML